MKKTLEGIVPKLVVDARNNEEDCLGQVANSVPLEAGGPMLNINFLPNPSIFHVISPDMYRHVR